MTAKFLANPACVMLLSALVAAPALAGWDVADTGQPFDDVRIAVSEGTCMSVDVSPDGKTLVFDLLGDLYLLPAAACNGQE